MRFGGGVANDELTFTNSKLVDVARRLLLLAELEVLAPLDLELLLGLARLALEPEHDLLRRLRLLVEDGLGLAAVALLLRIVAALPLGDKRRLARLVLGHLLRRVLVALLAVRVAPEQTKARRCGARRGLAKFYVRVYFSSS